MSKIQSFFMSSALRHTSDNIDLTCKYYLHIFVYSRSFFYMNYDIKAQIEALFPEDRKKMDYEDSTVKGHQVST